VVHYTVAAVILSSQHPSTRAGAESIQLIYSGRALQALTTSLGNFGVTPLFGGNFSIDTQQPRKIILRADCKPAHAKSCALKKKLSKKCRSILQFCA